MARSRSISTIVAAAAVLAGGGLGRAEPSRELPAAAGCTVDVVSAPGGVRAEIERWVAAEPRCARRLAVRVEPVDAGLHLIAVDPTGRVRERVVPDAQSVAVLVVSWMADDSIADPPAASPSPSPAPAHLPQPAQIADDYDDAPLAGLARRTRPGRTGSEVLAIGLVGTDDGIGIHGHLDLVGRRTWTLGIAGGLLQRAAGGRDRMDAGTSVAQASVFAAYTRSYRRFDARAQLGFGVRVATGVDGDGMSSSSVDVAPAFDAGAFLGVRLGARWSVLAGPLLDAPLDGRASWTVSGFIGLERHLR